MGFFRWDSNSEEDMNTSVKLDSLDVILGIGF